MFESFIRQILSCTVRLILIVMKLESVSAIAHGSAMRIAASHACALSIQ